MKLCSLAAFAVMSAGVVTFLDEGNKVVCLGGCPGGPPIE